MRNQTISGLWMAMLAVGIIGSFAARNSVADDFAEKHPRRAQVIKREKKQKNKNNAAAVNGKITDKQAQHLDKEDNKIRRQERADAAKNGGHITQGEQKQLNREENGVTRQRNRDERKDAAAGAAPAAPAAPAAAAPAAPAAAAPAAGQ
jgi:hypothetical protein